MSYNNLIEITKYLEEFEKQNKQGFSIHDFANWLSDKVAQKPRSGIEASTINDSITQQSSDVQISIMVGRMYKYARMYSKKVFSGTPLKGLDDYSFMATLMFKPSMTKSELIHYNLMDSVTSGADIIKRLLKYELIEEHDDENDKRSKRIGITEKGKQLMFNIFNKMDKVSGIITGNLSNDEKLFLLSYLKKLDHLHKDIYDNDRKSEINSIASKYIK